MGHGPGRITQRQGRPTAVSIAHVGATVSGQLSRASDMRGRTALYCKGRHCWPSGQIGWSTPRQPPYVDRARLKIPPWREKKWSGGGEGASAAFSMVFMTLVNIALAAHHFTPASEVIDGLSQDFFGTIEALGRQDCDFFLGGAVDFDAKGCQLQLTPLFRTQSDARDAAVALGRPTFFVSQWRANQCGAMTVVDGTTE